MQEIIQTTGNTNIIVRECNLASLKSVRNFAFDVLNSEERVDVLICNAGTGTPFGREYSFAEILLLSVDGCGPRLRKGLS